MLEKHLNQDTSHISSQVIRLNEIVQKFGSLLAASGMKINTRLRSTARKQIATMELSQLTALVNHFEKYVNLIEQAYNRKVNILDSKQLTWACLQYLKLKPCHDAFDKIEDDHVIEIYNNDHIQIFRNLKFFELCSYSVYEILIFDWPTLYYRDENILQEIFQQTQRALTEKLGTEFYSGIPPHILRERFSEEQRSFRIEMGMHSPLYNLDNSKQPEAVLLTLKATRI
ncbi:MAG: hypothetical protein J0L93_00390 [Deltaproteobacteria bacterium]|nr:hypothetical protein [Deltaproteobacteria bacterium]